MRNQKFGIGIGLVVAGLIFGMPSAGNANAPYMELVGATSAPIGYVELCQRQPSVCVAATLTPSVVSLTQKSWNELLSVNTYVNQTVEPVTDADLYGQVEHWTMPVGYGDCEDYVLMKRQMLIERGWPASSLLITVVLEPSGEGHAVLTVRTDRGDFILDNQEANVLRWDETGYRYVKRQSEFNETVWASINDHRV